LFAAPIIIQLLMVVGFIMWFNQYFVLFYGANILISTVAVIWILNNNSNPAYKIAWIIFIMLFPIFGGCIESIHELDADAKNQSEYIRKYSGYPLYLNTEAEYLAGGEVKFERLKEVLKKAERFIFLEYYIIEEGLMWNSILEILKEKAKNGVDVRVIYDGAGRLATLPYKYNRELESAGIKCGVFHPMIPVLSARLNIRDHRKITVIDGHTGITGGINLADEYINDVNKYGHWKDASIMIRGDAVKSLTAMYLSIWDYVKGNRGDMVYSFFPLAGS